MEEDRKYCCRYCPFQINTSAKLIEHIEISHKSEFNCKMCHYTVGQKNHLENHILENHKSPHQCLVCELYFRNIEDLSKHMDITHDKNDEILVKCHHCGKGCKDKEEIKTHIFEDHQTYKPCKKYGGGTCEARRCRFNHIKLQGKNEICFKCGKQFESKTDLINHIKLLHGNTICHKFLENKILLF